jgi:hypothetical protein
MCSRATSIGPDNLLSNGPVDILVNPTNTSVAVGQTVFFQCGGDGPTADSIPMV